MLLFSGTITAGNTLNRRVDYNKWLASRNRKLVGFSITSSDPTAISIDAYDIDLAWTLYQPSTTGKWTMTAALTPLNTPVTLTVTARDTEGQTIVDTIQYTIVSP